MSKGKHQTINPPKRPKVKRVATFSQSVSEELPYPIVHYPGFYGAFFAFQRDESSDFTFCSCTNEAIRNYIRFKEQDKSVNVDPTRNYILDSMYFPKLVSEHLMAQGVPSNSSVINHLHFADRLCHECKRATPSLSYCDPMYGGAFKQSYGWYINKQGFEFGVQPIHDRVLRDCCPQEILDLIEYDMTNARQIEMMLYSSPDWSPQTVSKNEIDKQSRRIWRLIENEVRFKFGHKKVGDAWTSETILYQIMCRLFPKERILRHYRGPELAGLELDVYLPDRKLGIEYQGIQHFQPVKHWGGDESLKRTQERDERKRNLCGGNGITLIYFYHNENLSEELVRHRLNLNN
ncbi:PDDEXK family nuclease [Alicyclobacillus mengziensis]|uniref:Restriction endonuclease n=1 Tax=Alicyclobacillus mengziensis TaxID=2931921 RepID=A0A9X7Z8U7_9BACL|nr:hypothetical protein [Alicyclobacillus mengziensis]QSO48768.1 hypothetical protein JZ786_07365 [Alicyclobacillus mengziensis]